MLNFKSLYIKYKLDSKGFESINMCQTSNMFRWYGVMYHRPLPLAIISLLIGRYVSSFPIIGTTIQSEWYQIKMSRHRQSHTNPPRINERFNDLRKSKVITQWMSIAIIAESFLVFKNDDKPYGSQKKVLDE